MRHAGDWTCIRPLKTRSRALRHRSPFSCKWEYCLAQFYCTFVLCRFPQNQYRWEYPVAIHQILLPKFQTLPRIHSRDVSHKIYHSIRRISRAVTKSYLERYREKSRFQEILPNSFPKGLSLTTLRSSFFLQIFLCFYFDCVCPIQHLILFPRVTYF